MCQAVLVAGDDKRAAIHAAAIEEFSQRGFSATSMANIADAAGMSRPALYQYFKNKSDIFSSAFVALTREHAERALDALLAPGSVATQLDGFLQRFDGDLWERLAASPHAEEIVSAKDDELSAAINAVMADMWRGLGLYLESVHPGADGAAEIRRSDWSDLLHLSPKGFKFDNPTMDVFRRRLTALAHSVAAQITTH